VLSEHIPGWHRAALGCPWAADGAVDKTVQLNGDELGWHRALQNRSALPQLRCSIIIIAIIILIIIILPLSLLLLLLFLSVSAQPKEYYTL